MQAVRFKLAIKFQLHSKEVSAVNAPMPVKLVMPEFETFIAPVNAAASLVWISASPLVLILALFTNAALKLASGMFTFWAWALTIHVRIVIPMSSTFFSFIIFFFSNK